MCRAPKAPKPPPAIVDTSAAVQDDRAMRRRRRGYLNMFKSGFSGASGSPDVGAKALTGQ